MTRTTLRWLARGLIGSLLSMQLALAAHACMIGLALPAASAAPMTAQLVPSVEQTDQPAARDMASDEVQPCFESSDDEASTLCNEHCKRGQQSDKAASLVVPMAWLTARYVIEPSLERAPLRRPDADAASALVAGQPPHSILHCVLRT